VPLRDSRRLTGPNLLLSSAGAILEVECADARATAEIASWRRALVAGLDALGWSNARIAERRVPGGALLAFAAPIDLLYAATELNEWAWSCAEAGLDDAAISVSLATTLPDLRAAAEREANPRLRALDDEARRRDIACLWDEHGMTLGLGAGSSTWPLDALPSDHEIHWPRRHDVPLALVTGTNGKTTTVRLVAAMLRAAGRHVGTTSTDGVRVDDRWLDHGDYSGPGGARLALRDPEVEAAVLETARGGILRRGLAVERATAALLTNVAEDHLGEFGVASLRDLLESKLVVASVVLPTGRVVLNADDPFVAAEAPPILAARDVQAPLVWYGREAQNPTLRAHLDRGGEACLVAQGRFVHFALGQTTELCAVTDAPITFEGAAWHNVSNALGAIALARALGAPFAAIDSTLRTFGRSAEENPGRGLRIDLGGITLLVDFAHNPHGMRALVDLALSLPARRRAILLGQAGDRDDATIRQLARVAWTLRPDLILLKEMTAYLRGRREGEVPELLRREFLALGATPERILAASNEEEALLAALRWAEVGDLLVLPIHAERETILTRIHELEASGWRAPFAH